TKLQVHCPLQAPSATLRLVKLEAGINALRPGAARRVPSIYSVSLLSRLRFALKRSLYFAFGSCSLVLRSSSQTQNKADSLEPLQLQMKLKRTLNRSLVLPMS